MINQMEWRSGASASPRGVCGRPGPGSLSRASRSVVFATLALLGAGLPGVLWGQSITEFTVTTANSQPNGIAAGPDGNLWFTEASTLANKIGRITTAGVITEFPIPTAASGANFITAGPDGNLWFTEENANKIGRITTAGVVINEFVIPTAGSEPQNIVTGPDGNLWFTEFAGNKVARITTGGVITEFPLPNANSGPDDITVGPDGNLWFVEIVGNRIGRITTAGVITEFPIPTAGSQPLGIASGSDGNLWFTEFEGNKIGRITTAGVFTEYPLPIANSSPIHIEAGPDGNLWFAQPGLESALRPGGSLLAARAAAAALNANQIGRVTTAGIVTEFTIPTADSQPVDIAVGSDNNLWFTEFDGNKIGKVDLTVRITAMNANNGPASGGIVANLTGTSFQGGATLTVGGLAATGVTVNGPTSIDLTTPALPAGTLNDVIVDNPDSSTATLKEGWLSDFGDVPAGHSFHNRIEEIFRAHITAGCGFGNYCPGGPVTRAQMAVFLLKGSHGFGFVPPPPTGTVFNDVGAGDFAAAWIEQLFAEGITSGCGGGNYCPNQTVTREQMAAFLLRAEHGSSYMPPPPVGIFDDVPISDPFAKWIEQLFNEGITAGCGGNNYCPDDPNTRGQMAVFISKTFGLGP
jgi:streptogramin lyase